MIHVRRLVLERATDEEAGAARALLSDDERARADAFKREVHRRRFALVRAALRRAVSPEDPASVRFREGPWGKPEVDGLHVNVSHTDGLALIAATRVGPVGVDVERVREDLETLDLSRRYFARREVDALVALDPRARARAFVRLWTRKEAVLKAAGRGLGGGLEVDTGDADARWSRVEVTGLGGFWVRDLDVGPDHAAAVAIVATDPPELTLT